MPALKDAAFRTRVFSRVIGPYLVAAPAIVALRAPDISTIAASFFGNDALVWVMGAMLLFGGLVIVAVHQIWSNLAAVLVSLFGWILILRGLLLLTMPGLLQQAALAVADQLVLVRLFLSVLVLAGLWLSFVGWIAKPGAVKPISS